MSTDWQVILGGYLAVCVLTYLWNAVRAPGFKVAGKHVLITGGSTGIGLATAKLYAKAGAKVSLLARDATKLQAAKKQIESSQRSDVESFPVYAHACDVTSFESMQAAVAAANAFQGRVTDHVICNAGQGSPGLLLDQDVSVFKNLMDTNYMGAVHTLKAALPAMASSPLPPNEPKRRVVFLSSAVGLVSFIGYSQYSATKYAVRGLAEAMRNELKLYGIETSVFCPGRVATPFLDVDDQLRPKETQTIVMFSSPPCTAEQAADSLVHGISKGYYMITNEAILFVLRLLANGVAPRINLPLELLLMPVSFVIEFVYMNLLDFIVLRSSHDRRAELLVQK